jgi:polyhydroxyalkanoate synthesis regulator protein
MAKVTVKQVIEAASQAFDVDVKIMQSSSRMRDYVDARSACFHVMKSYLNMSLETIGMSIKKRRTHATIICGINHFKNMMDTDVAFVEMYVQLLKALEAQGMKLHTDDVIVCAIYEMSQWLNSKKNEMSQYKYDVLMEMETLIKLRDRKKFVYQQN